MCNVSKTIKMLKLGSDSKRDWVEMATILFRSDTDQKTLQLLQAFEADPRIRMVASLLEDEGEVALDNFPACA